MKRAVVRSTDSFARNLDAIEVFLSENGVPATVFAALLDDLFDELIPALEEFPALGADLFRHAELSREAMVRSRELRRRLGPETSLREIIRGDYLLLYAHRGEDLFLLAIRHHRQLSFDFPDHWTG